MTHSLKEVIDTLRQIGTEMPGEQVACFYSTEGERESMAHGPSKDFACAEATTPLCIIGHLIYRLDGVEGLRKVSENLGVHDQPEAFLALGYTEEALHYMGKTQEAHDEGEPFGNAVMEGCYGA